MMMGYYNDNDDDEDNDDDDDDAGCGGGSYDHNYVVDVVFVGVCDAVIDFKIQVN